MLEQVLVNGLVIGMTYALVAMGLSLVFGVMGTLNVGHGDFIILGSVVVFVLYSQGHLPPFVGLPLALVLGAVLGGLTQAFLLERIKNADRLMSLLLLFGVGAIIAQSAALVVGTGFFSVPYWNEAITIGTVRLSEASLFALLAAVASTVALFLFLSRTSAGRAIRATAQEPELAAAVGVNTKKIRVMTFAIGGGLAAVAGSLLVTTQGLSSLSGPVFLMIAFASCILGGLGSVPGALVAGLVLGFVEVGSAAIVDIQFGQLAIYTIFILILLFRPQGIMGIRRRTV